MQYDPRGSVFIVLPSKYQVRGVILCQRTSDEEGIDYTDLCFRWSHFCILDGQVEVCDSRARSCYEGL